MKKKGRGKESGKRDGRAERQWKMRKKEKGKRVTVREIERRVKFGGGVQEGEEKGGDEDEGNK